MLTVRDLTLIRGGRVLFEGLSLTLPAGGALTIRGPNGSGKSSLLRALAGLLEPAAGGIDAPERIGWLGHDNALKPDRTLGSELAFWAGLDGATADARDAAVAAYRLAPLLALACAKLSAGQARRAGLARVAQAGAALWLLDEPATGLDAEAMGWLADAVAAHRAGGGAVVASTHAPLGWPAEELVLRP